MLRVSAVKKIYTSSMPGETGFCFQIDSRVKKIEIPHFSSLRPRLLAGYTPRSLLHIEADHRIKLVGLLQYLIENFSNFRYAGDRP